MTAGHQRLILLREERDYGSLELLLEKSLFRLHHVPVFTYQFTRHVTRPSSSSVILFSSRAGVRALSSRMRDQEKGHCFVIGEETQNALRATGFQGKIERFLTIQALLDHLSGPKQRSVKAIHYYRGDVVKNPDLGHHVRALGIDYTEEIVYKTQLVKEIPESIRVMIQDAKCPIGYIAVSARGMSHWDDLVFYHCLANLYRQGHLFCLSKDVASGSRIMPHSSITVPQEPSTTSLIESIQSYYKRPTPTL
jgi:uroporphyrinogen-III synthase